MVCEMATYNASSRCFITGAHGRHQIARANGAPQSEKNHSRSAEMGFAGLQESFKSSTNSFLHTQSTICGSKEPEQLENFGWYMLVR